MVGELIRARRKQLGLSAEDIAAEIGVSPATIYRYESGDIVSPGSDKLVDLSRALHTHPAYLMGWDENPVDPDDPEIIASASPAVIDHFDGDAQQIAAFSQAAEKDYLLGNEGQRREVDIKAALSTNNARKIPILGQVAAGLPLLAEQNIDGYTWTDLNGGAEYFALRVKGDSMNAAHIPDGSMVIVRRQEQVENGEIAVVLVGDQDGTVKRYRQDGDTVTLVPQSFNPAHQAQVYNLKNTDVKVLGLVRQIQISPEYE